MTDIQAFIIATLIALFCLFCAFMQVSGLFGWIIGAMVASGGGVSSPSRISQAMSRK